MSGCALVTVHTWRHKSDKSDRLTGQIKEKLLQLTGGDCMVMGGQAGWEGKLDAFYLYLF